MTGEIDPYAELEAIVTEMRRALARVMSSGPCTCPRTEREHAIEGAGVLLSKVPWAVHSSLATVLLADLHEAAPMVGFDVN